jgi:hypothetical protein
METYIKTAKDLNEVARVLARAVNVAGKNPSSYQREQSRQSANFGGEYYLFEVFGVTLTLVRNRGEVEVPERKDWSYYVIVACDRASTEFLRSLAEHLACLLAAHDDLDAEVDELSA